MEFTISTPRSAPYENSAMFHPNMVGNSCSYWLLAACMFAGCAPVPPAALPTLVVENVAYAAGRTYAIYGYNAPDGSVLVAPIYDHAEPFHPAGCAVVYRASLGGLIDRAGREIIPPLHHAGSLPTGGVRLLDLTDSQGTSFGDLPSVILTTTEEFRRHFAGVSTPEGFDFSREILVGIRSCSQCRGRLPDGDSPYETHRNACYFERRWWAVTLPIAP